MTVGALGLERDGEIAHRVLRLGDGHAVAGDDDDRLRRGEHVDRVLDARLVDAGARREAARGGNARRVGRAERAEEHVGERAVHRLAHHHREQEARGAVERAGDDEHVVAEREARRRRGETGVRVEQRDHDRHVGAADRQHGEMPSRKPVPHIA